jgi:DNA mismatch repair protein MutS2
MNDHSLRLLEFPAVRALLAEQTSCALGRERAEALAPLREEAEIRRRQEETTEAVALLDRTGQIPLGGVRDIRPALKTAAIEGIIEPSALLAVADTLAAARRLREFLAKHAETAPSLAPMARGIGDFPEIDAAIHAAVDEHADIRSDASPLLARLRKEARITHGRIMDRLQTILRTASYREMIQEPIVTVRDDRYCIPVKSEWRTAFGGLVHDQSSSGATVFMEPASVVELGNELRQLAIRDRQEVERILLEISARIGRHAPALGDTLELLGELDFIAARGRLSQAQDASVPLVSWLGSLDLRRARHPLLGADVVPIDVRMGDGYRALVITGPNTGGKTVTLKTVGLLSLMAQSGLHIPAASGSAVPVFAGVFADIGDEQSIQQSLSTFSGHICNIVAILDGVTRRKGRSLVLLDEVGAGTDPTEGAALAKAILLHLLDQNALCVATTHYGELKEFAYTQPEVENASVEFDLDTLRPTYRLLIGIPGSSNAFTIAARLELPGPVVAAARSLVGTDQAQLAEVIERLRADQQVADEHRRRATHAAEGAEALRARHERELKQLHADRQETLRRARAEADRILKQARQQADRLQEELRRIEKEARQAGGPAPQPGRRAAVRQAVRQAEETLLPEETADPAPPALPELVRLDPSPPQRGDPVWIAALGQRGVLLDEPADGRAQVQLGTLRTAVPYSSLQRIAPDRGRDARLRTGARYPAGGAATVETGGRIRLEARAAISPELHLRGHHVEEAIRLLDDYMDDACLAGISPIRIVHGKGTGTLRKAVWEWLQTHPQVEGFRLGEEGEGGGGVTVVQLRE